MNETSEKLLLLAAGAAVGALGYMAWKNRDELHEFVDKAVDLGKDFFDGKMNDFEGFISKPETEG